MADTEQEQALNEWLEGRPDVIMSMAEAMRWHR